MTLMIFQAIIAVIPALYVLAKKDENYTFALTIPVLWLLASFNMLFAVIIFFGGILLAFVLKDYDK